MWILIYIAAFIIVFAAFFMIGVAVPLNRYASSLKTDWNDESGEIIANLSYGDKEENTYDLYIPQHKL